MIVWSRRFAFVSGIALIVIINIMALAGVAYNRSGDPESALRLTERELWLPYNYNWPNKAENSRIALRLIWRGPPDETGYSSNPMGFINYSGSPGWLDKNKLAALGFDVSEFSAVDMGFGQPAREVLLVLELDGPAYQQALEHAMKRAADEDKLNIANAGNKEFAERSKTAREQLSREQHENSRLFVVDAGLDVVALRTKYPDRARYAIVRGRVRARMITREKEQRLSGYIESLSITEINVPMTFRRVFEPSPQSNRIGPNNTLIRFEAEVAFGKRLEPWIRQASRNSSE